MLFARRKQLSRMEEAEAQGQSFWTENLDEQARIKLFYLFNNLVNFIGLHYVQEAHRWVLEDLGRLRLFKTIDINSFGIEADVIREIIEAQEEEIFSLIEALIWLPLRAEQEGFYPNPSYIEDYDLTRYLLKFIEDVCVILREHRVAFSIVEGRFIPLQSRIMHENVVAPTLTLLGRSKEFANAEMAYLKALEELHKGSPDDAITDASTALQEALISLGCKGNSLGSLSNSATNKQILSPHDKKLIDWVSADRSKMGDAHTVNFASTEDAWLTVHVVGAIILRITSGSLRSGATR